MNALHLRRARPCGLRAGLLTALVWGTAAVCAEGVLQDGEGFRWDVCQNGGIGNGTNNTFNGGQLIVNGQPFNGGQSAQAREGRELVIGPELMGTLMVTRKVFVPAEGGCCRFLEVIENPTTQPAQADVAICAGLRNPSGQTFLPEAKGDEVPFAAVGQQGGPCSVAFCLASPSSKLKAALRVQDQNITLTYRRITLKPKQRVALLHVWAQRNSLEEAEAYAKKTRLELFVSGLDRADRVILLNVSASSLLALGGLELFRGRHEDEVKLNTGEVLRGALQTPSFALRTELGSRRVAGGEVLSLFGLADGSSRVVLQSGEVLTGRLEEQILRLRLRGGDELAVPLARLAKYGKRLPEPKAPKKTAKDDEDAKEEPEPEPEPETIEQFVGADPLFILRSGDRWVGQPVQSRFAVRTLYGEVALDVEQLRRMELPQAALRVPLFELADGSSFCGLPVERQIALRTPAGATVQLDLGRLTAAFFRPLEELAAEGGVEKPKANQAEEAPPASAGRMRLLNGDVFMGCVAHPEGVLTVATPFGPRKLPTDQIARIQTRSGAARAVRVTLWDGTMLPATLEGDALPFRTAGGAELSVPLDLIETYERPLALPPVSEAANMEALVAKLGEADPQVRDSAQRELERLGVGARGVLAKHWRDPDLETRTRVRQIFRRLQETLKEEAAGEEQG